MKIGRIAGQFAKPRSQPTELVDGIELPVFRGDIVNSPEPTLPARRPDAERLLHAYQHASTTLEILRALTQEGFAGLDQVHAWNQEFVRRSPAGRLYEKAADEITWALRFMTASGQTRSRRHDMTQLESFPIAPKVEPGDILRQLPAHPPEQGESFDAVLGDLDEIVVPGLLHWQHPRFFGYLPATR